MSELVKHIEAYVSSSSSPLQQDASVEAIATLVKNDLLTLEALVKEMDMYLTTTDSIIRSRGVLLLGESLKMLSAKPLNNTAIRSLIGFFTERLADWKALRGALVGCLALMRRKNDVGMVSESEADAVVKSFFENIQVQSLGQLDRKLCFQLLECLLARYPEAIESVGDSFVIYGICEAIDGEKDPECLIIAFQIVELLPRIYSDPCGPLSSFSADFFDLLGAYFPIHFTHAKGEDADVKREELSKALMLAFASTPLFEPFSVPLLLEKLVSSLPSAKVESLKYLSYCWLKYGADRMSRYINVIWSSIKETIYSSPESSLSKELHSVDGMDFQANDILIRVLELLQVAIQQHDEFLNLILSDEDINAFMTSLSQFKEFDEFTAESKQRLYIVGQILSVAAKSSIRSCNKVFGCFFPLILETVRLPSENCHPAEGYGHPVRVEFGYVYLCVEILSACRYLVVDSNEWTSNLEFAQEEWCRMLESLCRSLTDVFTLNLEDNAHESTHHSRVYLGVKGLQVLAMFPESFLPVSKSIYEDILLKLMSIITNDFNKSLLWESALQALVEIGQFVNKSHQFEKATSYESIVVEKIVSLVWSGVTMPLSQKLRAVFDIGVTGKTFMLRVARELEKAISANLSEIYFYDQIKSAAATIDLLNFCSRQVFPWFHAIGDTEEIPMNFAVSMWDKVGSRTFFSVLSQETELLDATMEAMKQAVGSCSAESQEIVLQKASGIVSSCIFQPINESQPDTSLVKSEGLELIQDAVDFSYRDEWIISLFASVIIPLRPETRIPDIKNVIRLFVKAVLRGHVPSAQALGSVVNKLPLKVSGTDLKDDFCLKEAVDMVVESKMWSSFTCDSGKKRFVTDDDGKLGFSASRHFYHSIVSERIHAVIGLAWFGKGLLMRGDEMVKDVVMIFLNCLLPNGGTGALPQFKDRTEVHNEGEVVLLMKTAADAFHTLLSDSEACLNKRYHATIRPLYKQRFFNIMMPILLSLIPESESSTRSMLYRAFSHLLSDTPLPAVLSYNNKVIPVLVDCLAVLSKDVLDKDITNNLILVLSGILMDRNGQGIVMENIHAIVTLLIKLSSYPYKTVTREIAIQCLVAMSELPHTRIYPLRTQVLGAISKALDDPKRIVRHEAVRCRQAWAAIV